MKKQYLICMLMIVLMLCGCTAAASDAAPDGAQPGLPAESNPPVSSGPMDTEPVDATPAGTELMGTEPMDNARGSDAPASAEQVGRYADWIDYGVGDGPHEEEETQYGRALDGEELKALWARLEGKWILSDSEEWKQSDGLVYEFSVTEYGDRILLEYAANGSSAYGWDWAVVREQDGVYTAHVSSESCEMTLYECHQNSGTLFTLQFTENGILLSWSRPARFEWWETEPAEYRNTFMITRLATEAEQELLANEADEYGQVRFEDGGALFPGYEHPAREYRLVTDEELERLCRGTGE